MERQLSLASEIGEGKETAHDVHFVYSLLLLSNLEMLPMKSVTEKRLLTESRAI